LDKSMVRTQVGDRIIGTVAGFGTRGVMIDIGGKAPAILADSDLALVAGTKGSDMLQEGQLITVEVMDDSNPAAIRVSMKAIQIEKAWDDVMTLYQNDESFEADVIDTIRNAQGMAVGVTVNCLGLRCFLPISHAVGKDPPASGSKILCKFLDVDPDVQGGRLVVSQRNAVVEQHLSDLQPGLVMDGTVADVKPYGVFVELPAAGHLNGLLHISQISGQQVPSVSQVFQIGSKIKVMVMQVDRKQNKISLSTKNLEREPGEMLEDPQAVYENAEETGKSWTERTKALQMAINQALEKDKEEDASMPPEEAPPEEDAEDE